jgi:hypothetical protein
LKSLSPITYLILPFVASTYFVLDLIFDIPSTTKVLGIIAILTLIFGILQFLFEPCDGKIIITKPEDNKTVYSLELDIDPSEIVEHKRIVLKVVKEPIRD